MEENACKIVLLNEIFQELFTGQVEAMVGCLSQVCIQQALYAVWLGRSESKW